MGIDCINCSVYLFLEIEWMGILWPAKPCQPFFFYHGCKAVRNPIHHLTDGSFFWKFFFLRVSKRLIHRNDSSLPRSALPALAFVFNRWFSIVSWMWSKQLAIWAEHVFQSRLHISAASQAPLSAPSRPVFWPGMFLFRLVWHAVPYSASAGGSR